MHLNLWRERGGENEKQRKEILTWNQTQQNTSFKITRTDYYERIYIYFFLLMTLNCFHLKGKI